MKIAFEISFKSRKARIVSVLVAVLFVASLAAYLGAGFAPIMNTPVGTLPAIPEAGPMTTQVIGTPVVVNSTLHYPFPLSLWGSNARISWGNKHNYLFQANLNGNFYYQLNGTALTFQANKFSAGFAGMRWWSFKHTPQFLDWNNGTGAPQWGLYTEGYALWAVMDGYARLTGSVASYVNKSGVKSIRDTYGWSVPPSLTSWASGSSNGINFDTLYVLADGSSKTGIVGGDNVIAKVSYNLTERVAFGSMYPSLNFMDGIVTSTSRDQQGSSSFNRNAYWSSSSWVPANTKAYMGSESYVLFGRTTQSAVASSFAAIYNSTNLKVGVTSASLEANWGTMATFNAANATSFTFSLNRSVFYPIIAKWMGSPSMGIVKITGSDGSTRYLAQGLNDYWYYSSTDTPKLWLVLQENWTSGVTYTVSITPGFSVGTWDFDNNGSIDYVKVENDGLYAAYATHVSDDSLNYEANAWPANSFEQASKWYFMDKKTGWYPDTYGEGYIDNMNSNYPSYGGGCNDAARLVERKDAVTTQIVGGFLIVNISTEQQCRNDSPLNWRWVFMEGWRYALYFTDYTSSSASTMALFTHNTLDFPGHWYKSQAVPTIWNVYLSDGQSTTASGVSTIDWKVAPFGANSSNLARYYIYANFTNTRVNSAGVMGGLLESRPPLEMRSTGDTTYRYTHISGFNRTVWPGDRVSDLAILAFADNQAGLNSIYDTWGGVQDMAIKDGVVYFVRQVDLQSPGSNWAWGTDRAETAIVNSTVFSPVMVGPSTVYASGNWTFNPGTVNGNGTWTQTGMTVQGAQTTLTVSAWSPSVTVGGATAAAWTASATSGTVYFNVTGLVNDQWYNLTVDGAHQWTRKASGAGTLSIPWSSWSSHSFVLSVADPWITGTVTDVSGVPIPGVSVYVASGGVFILAGITNSLGSYNLSLPGTGNYTVYFSMANYATVMRPVSALPGPNVIDTSMTTLAALNLLTWSILILVLFLIAFCAAVGFGKEIPAMVIFSGMPAIIFALWLLTSTAVVVFVPILFVGVGAVLMLTGALQALEG